MFMRPVPVARPELCPVTAAGATRTYAFAAWRAWNPMSGLGLIKTHARERPLEVLIA